MKHSRSECYYVVLLLAVMLSVASCRLVPYTPDALSVVPTDTIRFCACDNVSVVLTVSTTATTWSCEHPHWIVTEVVDDTLRVNVANNEGGVRSGNIVFSAGTAHDVSVVVTQEAIERTPRSIKQVVYLEVNNCNPLNILEYNLSDGTPFFDAVILFAANINYDRERDEVYLHNNPNVQALLNESETYLQPLRERGIKVYLGLLGNHDEAGLAQLSAWGAQQWAKQVAETCYLYRLDGVNLDDEYSLMPEVDNKWFTMPSAKAGARLAYELHKSLSETCAWDTEVSVFEYGALYNLPSVTVDGVTHTPGEFIDFIVANYGGRVYPYSDITYAQCSGASIELSHGEELTEKMARKVVEQGYGWCMWFAFDPSGTGSAPSNLQHSMQQFEIAADVFYNSTLLAPTSVYNKIGEGAFDPQPHPIQ